MLKIDGFIYRMFPEASPYGSPVTDLSINCPFCGDLKRHMNVSLVKEVCHCFRCGYRASWIRFVMDVTHFPYHLALGELYYKPKLSDAESVLSKLHDVPNSLEIGPIASLPDDFEVLTENSGVDTLAYRKYLKRRHFGPYYWKKYNLGISKKYPYRVIIPIEAGYWQGRSIVPWNEPRYINPAVDSGSIIFNPSALEMFDEIVVCEGAFSAMAVGANAIAMIGKEPTQEKMNRIIRSKVETVIVTLEPGAFSSMRRLLDGVVAAGKKVIVWKYNSGDPADSVDFESIEYNLRTRVLLHFDEVTHRKA